VNWLGIAQSKFYDWRARYGKVNEHNGYIPRDWWLENWEKKAITDFHSQYPLEGYRRLTFMMLDADVVAVSPSSVYRVLRDAGLMQKHNCKPSLKGKGFQQPLKPHEHWHVDVSYINIAGTFFYLCSLLDGCSRFIVHWEIRQTMTEADIETIIQRAREQYPEARPRIISDNGPQFIAKDFKEFIRLCGMTHVKTSPLPAEQWQDRAMAPLIEIGVHQARGAVIARRCPAAGRKLRAALQRSSPSQRAGLRDSSGQARRSGSTDLCRAGSEARNSTRTAAKYPRSSSASWLTDQRLATVGVER
jgi:hypothetical protein